MARTAEVSIIIRNNGTQVGVMGYSIIDLKGTLTGADEGNGVIGITGSGGGGAGTNVDTEIIAGVASGSNVTLDLTTLPHVVIAVEVVWRNGQALTPIADWSILSTTITVFNADPADVYMVQYTY